MKNETFDIIVRNKYSGFNGMRGKAIRYVSNGTYNYIVEIISLDTGKTYSDMIFQSDEIEIINEPKLPVLKDLMTVNEYNALVNKMIDIAIDNYLLSDAGHSNVKFGSILVLEELETYLASVGYSITKNNK